MSSLPSQGNTLRIVGITCPLYEVDQSQLDRGFRYAVKGIGEGDLQEYPRYQAKFDRLISMAEKIAALFVDRCLVEFYFPIGDVGIINAAEIGRHTDIEHTIRSNSRSYEQYFEAHAQNELNQVPIVFNRLSDVTGSYFGLAKPQADLYEAGESFTKKGLLGGSDCDYEFPNMSEHAMKVVRDQQLLLYGKGYSHALVEPAGFAFNYGLAGLALRQMGAQMIIGTDPATSYLNQLYHLFMQPQDLLVVVPK